MQRSLRGADAGSQRAGTAAGNVNDGFVRGGLIQGAEEALRLGQQIVGVIVVGFDEHVVDAEAIIAQGAEEIGYMLLLKSDALKEIKKRRGVRVRRVVESNLVRLRAFLVTEGLLAEISDPAVQLQVNAIEIVEFRGEGEDFRDERCARLKRLRIGRFVELADIERAGTGFVYFDLDEFRIAALKNFAEGDCRLAAGRCSGVNWKRRKVARCSREKNGNRSGEHESERKMSAWAKHLQFGLRAASGSARAEARRGAGRKDVAAAIRSRTLEAWAWHKATAKASAASGGSG